MYHCINRNCDSCLQSDSVLMQVAQKQLNVDSGGNESISRSSWILKVKVDPNVPTVTKRGRISYPKQEKIQ